MTVASAFPGATGGDLGSPKTATAVDHLLRYLRLSNRATKRPGSWPLPKFTPDTANESESESFDFSIQSKLATRRKRQQQSTRCVCGAEIAPAAAQNGRNNRPGRNHPGASSKEDSSPRASYCYSIAPGWFLHDRFSRALKPLFRREEPPPTGSPPPATQLCSIGTLRQRAQSILVPSNRSEGIGAQVVIVPAAVAAPVSYSR